MVPVASTSFTCLLCGMVRKCFLISKVKLKLILEQKSRNYYDVAHTYTVTATQSLESEYHPLS
jgi:hypothetical protein